MGLALMVQSLSALNIHPAVQAELKQCLAHGIVLANAISQDIQDAKALEKLRKNAKVATVIATTIEQKAIAAKEKARFFEALKKDQTKVEKPQIKEDFVDSLHRTMIIFIAALPEMMANLQKMKTQDHPTIYTSSN